jgi:hypothetical protein
MTQNDDQTCSPTPHGLVYGGWLPVLTGTQLKVWCAVWQESRRQSDDMGWEIDVAFSYRKIELHSGIHHNRVAEALLQLEAYGLLQNVRIGTSAATPAARTQTRVTIPVSLPFCPPKSIGITLNEGMNHKDGPGLSPLYGDTCPQSHSTGDTCPQEGDAA